MKKNSRFSGIYLGIIFFLMYLPVVVVIIFSFNESKLPVRFSGFSLTWYQELFQDEDMLEALKNSLILGVSSCLLSAVIGTLGAVGLARIKWRTKGILEYVSILPLMIPEIILGMVLMAFFRLFVKTFLVIHLRRFKVRKKVPHRGQRFQVDGHLVEVVAFIGHLTYGFQGPHARLVCIGQSSVRHDLKF